jgi:hypothetical protein
LSNYIKGSTLYGDSVGFLSKTPVDIKSVIWVPNSAADVLVLSWFNLADSPQVAAKTFDVAITSTNTVTDALGTGLTNAYRAGDAALFNFGNGDNRGLHLIATAGNNSRIITEADLTNIAADKVNITTYAPQMFAKMYTAAKDTLQFHYDKARKPNLAITTIAGSGIVLVEIA